MSPTTKAITLASALTVASVLTQLARGQEFTPPPPSTAKISQPLIMQKTDNSAGLTATLIVDCSIPKTYLTLKGVNGGTDIYTFDAEGVPAVDSLPPTGATPTPDLKKSVITRMMKELGERQIQDFSPENLCRDGRPNIGAAAAILSFITGNAREFDI